MRTHALALPLLVVVACAGRQSPRTVAYPLLDGRCEEYGAAQQRSELAPGVTLFELQDEHYVWLCYTIPPDSTGTMDMWLAAPGLGDRPLNLHVSSSLGEWPATDREDKTAMPADAEWWNNHGWAANWIGLSELASVTNEHGIVKQVPRFQNPAGRELQLSKARFGRGDWNWWIEIRGIKDGGAARTIRFPSRGARKLVVS